MGSYSTSPKVYLFFQTNPNIDLPIAEIAAGTGLTEGQAQNAISTLRSKNIPIETVIGNVYRYSTGSGNNIRATPAPASVPASAPITPTEPAKDSLYEVVGRTKSGDTIVRGDASGDLFKICEL